ncbi:MAG: GNAT family N-acetyltransferase [Treponema sp.]|nr:GNAT family N-acetyltransferase [Treponema sp.]
MIRRAQEKDLQRVNDLLHQVLEVHADGRPDIFIHGTKKYSDEELLKIFEDDKRPVFVYEDDGGIVQAYAFCIFEETKNVANLRDMLTLYIDDICVDQNCRGQGVATKVFEHVKKFAQEKNCNRITLNVWEMNPGARKFYEAMGMKPLKTVMESLLP